jgi:hypothetical protein
MDTLMVIVLSDIIHNIRRFYREHGPIRKVGSPELRNLNLEAAFAIRIVWGVYAIMGIQLRIQGDTSDTNFADTDAN